jgi:uncharacterized protein
MPVIASVIMPVEMLRSAPMPLSEPLAVLAFSWEGAGATAVVALFAIIGIGLTLVTLPGTWLMIVAALLCQWWRPDMFSWWTLGVAIGLALLAEIIEFAASALGAAKAGGSKRGAIGATVGSLAGALLGSPFLFPIGTIAGGVMGAGAGALLAERGLKQKTWTESSKVAGGAAVGRLIATVTKTSLAAVIAVLLVVGSLA